MNRWFDTFLKQFSLTIVAVLVLLILFEKWGTKMEANALRNSTRSLSSISSAMIPPIRLNPSVFEQQVESKSEAKLASSPALLAAQSYLELNREQLKLQPYHEFRGVEFQSPMGTQVKFSVFQENVPVIGLGIEIMIGRNGIASLIDNQYRPVKRAVIIEESVLPHETILQIHQDRYAPQEGVLVSSETSKFWYVRAGSDEPELSYVLPMTERVQHGRQLQIVFRATDGQVLARQYARSEF